MKHEKFFRKDPEFTSKELDDHLSTMGTTGPRRRESLLNYHRKTGHVVVIRRGLYAVIPPGSDPDSNPVDPFVVASKLTTDAVLSHHTALEVHGYSYFVREHLTYSASRPLSSVNSVLSDLVVVWLSLNQIAELFDRDISFISSSLDNIFKSGELRRDAVVANDATTATDGKTYQTKENGLIIFCVITE